MNHTKQLDRRPLPTAASFTNWRRGCVLLLALLWLASVGQLRAQEDKPSEYQVKAAFLYNFGKFVIWPTNAFADAYAPLVIGVVGEDPFHGDLKRLVAHKKIDGHMVIIRTITSADQVKGCHIIFLSSAAQSSPSDLLAAVRQPGILTVTENLEHFTNSNLIINFVRLDNRIRFEINVPTADKAGLKISSRLLPLSKPAEK